MFQETVLRCQSDVFDSRPIVVGADAHRFLIAEALEEIGAEADILLEPVPRNSCAAITAGCFAALARSADSTVLVLAADHHIPERDAFSAAVAEGCADADSGYLITFGVKPNRPTSAYGYILPGEQLLRAAKVQQFLEKPALDVAQRLVGEGYLWNSGNFLFRADAYLEELERLQPDVFTAVGQAWEGLEPDLQFKRLEKESFGQAPSISVDYAVMERTRRAAVLPVSYAWSDVGSWDAVAGLVAEDETGNAIIGDGTVMEGSGNLIHSECRLTTLIGVDELVVVSTRDSVLVVPKSQAEKVKSLVGLLQEAERREANEGLQMFRPWGNYEQLDCGVGYQVKRLVVRPGGVLSLQRHSRRAEHWVVVQGMAEVTVGGTVREVGPDESVYVPLGSVHRVANRRNEPVILIEVQTGSYLGEDDIFRLEDTYNRRDMPTSLDTRQSAPAEM
jgi:mannose-1-phosphate guanylyltransferase/mannose-6-phosphate isomerase